MLGLVNAGCGSEHDVEGYLHENPCAVTDVVMQHGYCTQHQRCGYGKDKQAYDDLTCTDDTPSGIGDFLPNERQLPLQRLLVDVSLLASIRSMMMT